MECNRLLQAPYLTSQLWRRVPQTESPNERLFTLVAFAGITCDNDKEVIETVLKIVFKDDKREQPALNVGDTML